MPKGASLVVEDAFDYIIVGAGAAGSVLANRLTANPTVSVLLLEYGGRDLNPMLYIPKGFYFTLKGDRYTYQYPTKPFKADGTGESWTRGKVMGGSTSVNGMMYARGSKRHYDELVKRGNPGWGWDDMLPIFLQMEDHQLGASPMRGAGGSYGVSLPDVDDAAKLVLESARSIGMKVVADTNAESGERIGMTPSSIKNGKRVSAASAFLHPIRHRANLTVLNRTRVGQLLFDGNRVIGVRARRRGQQVEFRARREVLVSAGTIESTMLLERSGIGRGDVLSRAGIPLRVESPNVGERVIEQRGATMQVKFKRPIGRTEDLNTLPKQGWEGFKYLLTRRGPVADAGYNILAGIASSPEHADHADIQGLFVPLALDATSFDAVKLAKHSGVMFLAYGITPTTTSSIHVTSADPDALPEIDAHYLETEEDQRVGSQLLDKAREVFAADPIAALIQEEEFPGPDVSTPEQVLAYAKDPGATIYHAVGANGMGPNDDDVTDSRLRVRGVSGLRVIDASSFPIQVSGNTAAPTMALGWRGAELIAEEDA